ncbi:BlaI/MecI/CopY family transcriptional regulator [Mesohalobacter halotolerans]|jgi:predicted transcriptional regulator|uniref:BlaI/MecI/CopY family transcriptional regulator n=1 Tax=Mesohalobacter halotolerans TaxID=1883405 RepID=A0A4U5TRV5_9FLAO|nr:BlaI/MecI/CopY family transcriptional regulator [Mesohalobacter halotolerans]NBC58315.1 BlaI/MecI/CopY family transcriptional regulator [Bacteroidota bacterium]TKS57007.1 BlaI/MecI/CopY family transcriptional regulator [Mesohalobacter halotolerans]
MKSLTKAESEIMRILWRLDKANVSAIIAEMPKPQPAYNTVSTIVRILEQKGFVDYEKQGRGHVYFPKVSEEDYKTSTTKRLANTYFEGSFKNMVSFFVQKNDLSTQELEAILKDLKSKNYD